MYMYVCHVTCMKKLHRVHRKTCLMGFSIGLSLPVLDINQICTIVGKIIKHIANITSGIEFNVKLKMSCVKIRKCQPSSSFDSAFIFS